MKTDTKRTKPTPRARHDVGGVDTKGSDRPTVVRFEVAQAQAATEHAQANQVFQVRRRGFLAAVQGQFKGDALPC